MLDLFYLPSTKELYYNIFLYHNEQIEKKLHQNIKDILLESELPPTIKSLSEQTYLIRTEREHTNQTRTYYQEVVHKQLSQKNP